ncbi:hypothetical protein QQS21_007093 [Conoideocrella luteorostrata]|uniref:Uncharacterized protein n=1 Tax=Conoideocrella luteorostrata TaxID=1105319 RepID=A0AAJ0CNT4_9HYPO|nr:hypothetical protein QQS21_007093 [Conoideocrella luteorostrata]
MNARLVELRNKYLQHSLLCDSSFEDSITKESLSGSLWTISRSYTDRNYAKEEHFDIELFDGDNIPHVRCNLKLVVRSQEAPQNDTRRDIFKAGSWIGPEMKVEVVDRQLISSQARSATTTRELLPEKRISTPKSTNEDFPASPTESQSLHPSNSSTTTLCSAKDEEQGKDYSSVEYRLLTVAETFSKGCQILVNQESLIKRLQSFRRCFGMAASNRSLNHFWQQLKDQKTPIDDVYPATYSYLRDLRTDLKTMANLSKYLTGLKQYRILNNEDRPAARLNRSLDRLSQGLDCVVNVISQLSKYYGDAAMSIFTFLEVGRCAYASLGSVRVEDKEFLLKGLIALFDLTLRRSISTAALENSERTIPGLNPVAFLSWYEEEEECIFEATCAKFDLLGFKTSPTKKFYFETPISTIFSNIRDHVKRIAESGAENEINNDIDRTDSNHKFFDESKNFILEKASRLAEYISQEAWEKLERASSGSIDKQNDERLALRIMKHETSPEETAAASMTVVYIIVDALLFNKIARPKPTSRKVQKRKLTTETETNESTSPDDSSAQLFTEDLSLWSDQQDYSANHHGLPYSSSGECQTISRDHNRTITETCVGTLQGMDAGAILPSFPHHDLNIDSGMAPNQIDHNVEKSQSDGLLYFPSDHMGGPDLGGMDASDGLLQIDQRLFHGDDLVESLGFPSGELF